MPPATFNTKVNTSQRSGGGARLKAGHANRSLLKKEGIPPFSIKVSAGHFEIQELEKAGWTVVAAGVDGDGMRFGREDKSTGPPPASRFVAYLFDDMTYHLRPDLAQARAASR